MVFLEEPVLLRDLDHKPPHILHCMVVLSREHADEQHAFLLACGVFQLLFGQDVGLEHVVERVLRPEQVVLLAGVQ